MVLVIEEISMVSAAAYNMLDFRAMWGRSRDHGVYEHTYKFTGNAFGRVPIVIHLGDFLQLRPTNQISLLDDFYALNEDGFVQVRESRCGDPTCFGPVQENTRRL